MNGLVLACVGQSDGELQRTEPGLAHLVNGGGFSEDKLRVEATREDGSLLTCLPYLGEELAIFWIGGSVWARYPEEVRSAIEPRVLPAPEEHRPEMPTAGR